MPRSFATNSRLRIALAQIDSYLGDFAGNRLKILECARRAKAQHCDLVIFPELALFGYMPMDLLEREELVKAQIKELNRLTTSFPTGIAGLVGAVTPAKSKIGKAFYNSAVWIEQGQKPKSMHKCLLPYYDIFDEERFFLPGNISDNSVLFKGCRLQITICEDIWPWHLSHQIPRYTENIWTQAKIKKPDLIINMSASPFTQEKAADRTAVVKRMAKQFKVPVIYVNMVGAQDEVIFDGGSFAVSATGIQVGHCARFIEDLGLVDLDSKTLEIKSSSHGPDLTPVEALRQALVLGIRDFCHKTRLTKIHLGLSGGIDSALVACLAVDALGPSQVKLIAMPGPFNPDESRSLAQALAKNLGVPLTTLPIDTLYEIALESLQKAFGDFEFGVLNENLQSRIRGLLLMAYSNKENSLLLATGNKSEYATGYSTLYGDMCGGLAPIGDLLKKEVYLLARHYNSERELIPKEILDRAPSAELRPNQKDSDSLPNYDLLDAAVDNLVTHQKAAVNRTERWVLSALYRSEFKRWQAAPILKVSRHAFGRGRRMPIAHMGKD